MFDEPFYRSSASDIPWLVNKRGHAMELDGYNADLSLAFEHNGQQHYELDGFFHKRAETLALRLEDDYEKIRLCRENGVKLIIIPFSVRIDDIQEYVLKELAKVGVTPRNTTSFEPGILAPSRMEKLRQYAIFRGGQLLSEKYQGSAAKLTWKCKDPKHPPFKAAPSTVLSRGSWCKRCAGEKQADSYRISSEQVRDLARSAKGELVKDEEESLLTEKRYALTDKANFRCLDCNRIRVRTIRQVKEGRLCLCHTKKTRIDREAVETKLAQRSMDLIEPVIIQGGRSIVTVECKRCGTSFPLRVRNIINDGYGCPKCRRNARITIEKTREYSEKYGFTLLSTEVNGGNDILLWECKVCGGRIEKAYREMRNVHRCPHCNQNSAKGRLKIN
jgi:transcription elongation factor Elf1